MPGFYGSSKLEVVPRRVVPTLLVVCYYQLLLLLPCASFMLSWTGFPVLFTAELHKGVSSPRSASTYLGLEKGCYCFCQSWCRPTLLLSELGSVALLCSSLELKRGVDVRNEPETKVEPMCVWGAGLLLFWHFSLSSG